MPTKQWQKIREIFEKALEVPFNERAPFVSKAANGDPDIQKEVHALLDSEEQGKSFLKRPVGLNLKHLDFSTAHPVPDFKVGERVGDFILLRRIGQGAFAKVYLARDTILEREVALKISLLRGNEAKTMAMMEHENIVSVFSQSADDAKKWQLICMQYVDGYDLEKILEKLKTGVEILGDDPLLSLFNLAIKLSAALSYAHKRGVLHLDIKPANILLTQGGVPMLSDFNVSLRANDLKEQVPDSFGGTFDFMAPEHRHAFEDPSTIRFIDQRSDIFSMGKVFLELLQCLPPDPRRVGLDTVIGRCIKQDKSERFQSADDLHAALVAEKQLINLQKSLPAGGRWLNFFEKHGIPAILVLILLPNILASLFNIAYNHTEIVRKLSPEQEVFFRQLLPWYNSIAYLIYSVAGIWIFREVLAYAKSIASPLRTTTPSLRLKVVNFPKNMGIFLAFCWAGGSIFWPSALHFFKGGLEHNIIFHFSVSFLMSWLIAMTYSVIGLQFLVVRVLYPKLLFGQTDLRAIVADEIPGNANARFLRGLSVALPLIGAILVVFRTPTEFSSQDLMIYQILVVSLISGGMVGLLAALKLGQLIEQSVSALRRL